MTSHSRYSKHYRPRFKRLDKDKRTNAGINLRASLLPHLDQAALENDPRITRSGWVERALAIALGLDPDQTDPYPPPKKGQYRAPV